MATRSTAKKAEQSRISQIGDFKKRIGGELELPSGLTIKWRNPGGLRAFMAAGKIPNVLLNQVDRALKGGPEAQAALENDMIQKLQEDPEMINQLMELYDDVAIKCFVQPRLHPVPTMDDVEANNLQFPEAPVEDPEELRSDDKLYVDEIPDDDKAYLFSLLSGGVQDLERFRQEHQIDVDRLARVSGVVGQPVVDSGADAG